tara:strand:- start:76 stop:420 length:345 start_codon:yes stop_codon:yes gene_type:complete
LQKELLELLRNSKNIYDNYIFNGRIFLYAKNLRLVNGQILSLLKKTNFEKKSELEKPSFALKKHIEEWIIIWDKEKLTQNPQDNDVFIFNGYKKYPKDLELLLISRIKLLNPHS